MVARVVAEEVVTVLEQRGIVSVAGDPSRQNGKEKETWRENESSLDAMDRTAIEGGFESIASIQKATEVLAALGQKKKRRSS